MPAENILHQSETSQETVCFPVTKEAVDRALSGIAENPDRVMVEEGAVMQVENPELNLILMSLGQSFQTGMGINMVIFSEGALWTYRILRTQADLAGKALPKISEELARVTVQDQINSIREFEGKSPRGDFEQFIEGTMKEISSQEPELGKAVGELTKYRAGKISFYHGVVNVYLPIKKALRSAELDRKFTLGK